MIFAKHLAQWSIPTFMETVTKAIVMALAAYVLPKTDFGILILAALIYSFHPYLQLGVVDGLMIKLPGYYVQRRIEKIRSSLGLSLSYVLTVIITALLSGVFLSVVIGQYDKTLFICAIYFLTAIPYQIYNHYLLLNRYTYNLQATFKARSFNAGLRLFFQVPLIYYFGIYGLVIGEVLIFSFSASLLLRYSKITVNLNLNLKTLKAYLIFGFPVWIVSLIGMFSMTLERSISAYYFNLKVVADVGLLAFFGSLFLLPSGQILSLFSQYAREFLVKEKNVEALTGAYLIFSLICLFLYVIFASLFYGITAYFVIPKYLIEYLNIVKFFPIVYTIFLVRILLSILSNLLLISGDRKNLFIGYLIFFIFTILASLTYYKYSEFTLNTLLFCIVLGGSLQLLFLLVIWTFRTKYWVLSAWLFFSMLINCFFSIYFLLMELSSWLFLGCGNLLMITIIMLPFIRSKHSYDGLNSFRIILQKSF